MELSTFLAAFCVFFLSRTATVCASKNEVGVVLKGSIGRVQHANFAAVPLFSKKLKLIMGVNELADQDFVPRRNLKEASSGKIHGKKEERVKVEKSENLSTMDYGTVKSRRPIHN